MSTHLTSPLPSPGLTVQPKFGRSAVRRIGLAALFLALGLATFVLGCNYMRRLPTNVNPVYEGALALVCLGAALAFRRTERLKAYWPVAYAFFVANMVWLVTTLLAQSPAGGPGRWALRLWGLTATTPMGVAVAKLGEAAGITAIILVLWPAGGFSLGSLYLRRGHLKWALAAGCW